MANLTTVDLTAGVPTAGTGTVMTLNSIAAVLPAALAAGGGLKIEGVAGGVVVPISVATIPSHAVTNAGTFAVQAAATLAAETTKVIGTVNVAAAQTIAATNAGTFAVQAAVTAASGSFSSGALASGSVASGAFASGALASGSVASGAIASGAIAAGAIAAGATSIADNEDVASADGDRGVKMLVVRKNTAASTSGTDGDYQMPITNTRGALWMAIEDGSGGQVTSFSGPTQYTEDAVAAADPVGSALMAVRRDTLVTNEVSADGDNIALKATNKGQLHVLAAIDSTQLGALGQATAANSQSTTHASDRENSIAFPIAMTTDTNVYASGDLIADTQQLDAFFNKADGRGVVNSITIIDQDAQGVALYVIFHSTSTSMGTENSAPNISDANALGIQGIVAVATTDYVTVSGTKVACIKGIGLPVKAVSGTDDIYVSVLNATGTPTFTATGLNLVIGAMLD